MTDRVDPGVSCERSMLHVPDGHALLVDTWRRDDSAPVAIVQILHGLSEHAARYERFAQRLAAEGFVVVAHNHRGHGETRGKEELGHFADRNGWNKVIQDAHQVGDDACQRWPGLPLVLFGHSMGSYIAQCLAMRYPDSVAALVLSGSTRSAGSRIGAGRLFAWLEKRRHGTRYRSPRLNAMAFGAFNKPFEPARTAFDWLSRDEREVDRYIADPLCGAVPSAGLWLDLLGGLREIGRTKAMRAVPPELPVLIAGGERDPVGGGAGMARLAAAWESSGHAAVTLKTYPDGRHEMLNEINRGEFMEDVIAWLKSSAASVSGQPAV